MIRAPPRASSSAGTPNLRPRRRQGDDHHRRLPDAGRTSDGKVVFIAAEGRDITEKKAYEREIARQREELAKLDELKTQFFANISHEFRTPLTLMLGPLEDACEDADGFSRREPRAARARTASAAPAEARQHAARLLAHRSGAHAGRLSSPPTWARSPRELASIFRSVFERAGLRLIVDCRPLSEPVYVDREMWEKIVLNLVSNAFKFTFDGEIRGLR